MPKKNEDKLDNTRAVMITWDMNPMGNAGTMAVEVPADFSSGSEEEYQAAYDALLDTLGINLVSIE